MNATLTQLSGGLNELEFGFLLIAAGCWLAAVALMYATPAFERRYGMPRRYRGAS